MSILSLLISTAAFAQAQPSAPATPSPEAQEANTLFQARKWDESAKAYEALTKAQPNNGQAWFRLGASLMSSNKHEQAIAPLQKAVQILQGPLVMYTLGTAYARLNDKDKAFEWLNTAAGAGFAQLSRLQTDQNLASLRDDARFKALAEGVEKNARPCKYSPEAKQFDFWVGVWDVQVNGQTVGTNVIERLEEGCLLMENWTGNGGVTGKSMNFYNPALKKWRQIYMSNNQLVWEMSGEFSDGAMRYVGEVLAPSGSTMTRVTFYNLAPDRVRHTQDNSTDGGKTWTTVWDSMYLRKKVAAQ
ncbi:MAG: tetratricopeptide repeat protein [Pyrinomonadaceae bacterium]